MKDKWYIATLIIRSRIDNDNTKLWTCDEQVRVIRAHNAELAHEKAVALGKEEEVAYKNMLGETVHWEFIGLEDLEELSDKAIRDGTEIRSRLFKHDNPLNLVSQEDQLSVYLAQRNIQRSEYKIINEREPSG